MSGAIELFDSLDRIQSLDRIMRERPTSFTKSAELHASIEKVNRATRERSRAKRRALVISTLD